MKRMHNWIYCLWNPGLPIFSMLSVLLFFFIEHIGQRSWLFGILLLVPKYVIVIPLSVLIIAYCWTEKIYPKYSISLLSMVSLWYLGYNMPAPPIARADSVAILSNNIGRYDPTNLVSFIEAEKPDIVTMQETGTGANNNFFTKLFPNYQMVRLGEFMLLSKYPVNNFQPVEINANQTKTVIGVRYEIEFKGKTFVLYNIHLPSPRPELDLFSRKDHFFKKVNRSKKLMELRVELSRKACERMLQEHLPLIVAGDFNIPDHGYMYRLFSANLIDSFKERGSGFGWTFPGHLSNTLLNPFCPWLRLDYIFCNKKFSPTYFKTGQAHQSQHLPIVSRFILEE